MEAKDRTIELVDVNLFKVKIITNPVTLYDLLINHTLLLKEIIIMY
jgi:hypothetical protein